MGHRAGQIRKSQANGNTAGSQPEQDLQKLLEEGKTADDELLTYEQKFLESTSWADAEHVKAATLRNQVVKLCQRGNKILPFLKSWQKYEPLS